MAFIDQYIGKSGVYFISPGLVTPYDTPLVKVGLSTATMDFNGNLTDGLASRLASYLLCYPFGFKVYAIITTTRPNASKVEKLVHRYFTAKEYKSDFDHSRAEEWYFVTAEEIRQTLELIPPYMILSKQFFSEPVLVDTNGRSSQRPVRPMSPDTKTTFESSSLAVPMTEDRGQAKRLRPNDNDQNQPPVFNIDSIDTIDE